MRRIVGITLRLVAALVLAAGLLLTAADGAGAKVHGVSQAGCSGNPNSGANVSGDNSPDGPIPITASDGAASAGQGGDGTADCDVPPGPPAE